MNGYILESRSILESDIWDKPPLYFKVWHYLLLKARFAPSGGLERGQLFTSINEIREACSYKVGYRKVKPSKKEIWGIIDWLRSPHERNYDGNSRGTMIVTTKVTHGMIVTICNFNHYQNPNNYESNNESNDENHTKELRRERKGNNKKEERYKKDKKYKKEKDKKEKSVDELISEMPEELQETLRDFVEMRKQNKSPLKTQRQFTLLANKLNELSGGDSKRAKAILEQSIMNGWKSVYEVKEQSKKKTFMDVARDIEERGYGN